MSGIAADGHGSVLGSAIAYFLDAGPPGRVTDVVDDTGLVDRAMVFFNPGPVPPTVFCDAEQIRTSGGLPLTSGNITILLPNGAADDDT